MISPIKTQTGFSLLEVIIAGSLLGAISLALMQMNSNMFKGQATAKVKMEEIELRRLMISVLAEKRACENTFSGISVGQSVSSIKTTNNSRMFEVGKSYGSNSLQLQSMTTRDKGEVATGTRMIDLLVTTRKLQKQAYGADVKSFTIPLKVNALSATALVTSCYSDENAIVSNATKEACLALGGVWNVTTSSCTLSSYVRKTGDTMTGNLSLVGLNASGNVNATGNITTSGNLNTAGSVVAGADLTASGRIQSSTTISAQGNITTSQKICTNSNCKSLDELALANQSCPNGQVANGVKADGKPNCRALQCPGNQFFAGIDVSNNPVCRPYPTNTCPTNQYVKQVNADGTVQCDIIPNTANATCPAGHVLQSISAGTPTCVPVQANISCPDGLVLRGISNGNPVCGSPVSVRHISNSSQRNFVSTNRGQHQLSIVCPSGEMAISGAGECYASASNGNAAASLSSSVPSSDLQSWKITCSANAEGYEHHSVNFTVTVVANAFCVKR